MTASNVQQANTPATQTLRIVTNQLPVIAAPPANLDTDQLAIHWLRQTYDVVNGAVKPQPQKLSDIYEAFVKYCAQLGRKTVVNSVQFATLLKKTFATSNLINNTHVDGLAFKRTVAVITTTNTPKPGQLMSPILKAHLSAPPRGPPLSPTAATTAPSTPATTAATSTLIKSLLASKLRGNAAVTTLAPSIDATQKPTSTLTVPNAIVATKSDNVVAAVTTKAMPNAAVENSSVPKPTEVRQPIVPKVEPKQDPVNASSSATMAVDMKPSTITLNAVAPVTSVVGTMPMTVNMANAVTMAGGQQILLSAPPNASGQQPQQYLLVRTIVGGQTQQGLVGVPTGSGQIRLILPSNMLTQQRTVTLNPTAMNGIANHQPTVAAPVAANPPPAPQPAAPPASTANDILLKAVLGSGITSDAPASPPATAPRSNVNATVKSSPLLNVLLDKGKLPENPTITAPAAPTTVASLASIAPTTNNASVVSVNSGQQPKMYILTTKSGVPIKALPQATNVQQQPMQQTVQNATIAIKPEPQPISVSNPDIVVAQTAATATVAPVKPPASQPLLNGDASLPEIAGKKPSNTNDLSSIKDIQRAVDDAPKLIANSKRSNEEEGDLAAKKAKTNHTPSSPVVVNSVATKSSPVANGAGDVKVPVSISNEPSPASQPAANGSMNSSPIALKSDAPTVSTAAPVVSQTLSPTPTTPATPAAPVAPAAPAVVRPIQYTCEWNGCKRLVCC